jgi:ureidoacrylate peracid hydrolase
MAYPKSSTALLLVDPYNDFLVQGGKLFPRLKDSLEAVGLIPRLIKLVEAARKHRIPIYFVPHRQYRPGDYEDFKFPTASQSGARDIKAFEHGSWGGQFHEKLQPDITHGDVIASEHFTTRYVQITEISNVKLNRLQRLRKHEP